MSEMAGAQSPVLILSRSDIAGLMSPADYLRAVERGFRALHEGAAHAPAPWHIEGDGGAFHGKGASLRSDRLFVALKLNGNFPGNPDRLGLPTVQGAILLFDGRTGSPLAIMDAIEITLRRTAAATALAARHLARAESTTLLLCGCGDQALPQIEAICAVLPISQVLAFDRDRSRARRLAEDHPIARPAEDLGDSARIAHVIITATPASDPFLTSEMVSPGTFVAAVGADAPYKNEICPALMRDALVVADSIDQCARFGDLHHAIDAGMLRREDVHAELAEIVAGAKCGRSDDEQITLFDSTGVAVQDVASAAAVFGSALAAGKGASVALAA